MTWTVEELQDVSLNLNPRAEEGMEDMKALNSQVFLIKDISMKKT